MYASGVFYPPPNRFRNFIWKPLLISGRMGFSPKPSLQWSTSSTILKHAYIHAHSLTHTRPFTPIWDRQKRLASEPFALDHIIYYVQNNPYCLVPFTKMGKKNSWNLGLIAENTKTLRVTIFEWSQLPVDHLFLSHHPTSPTSLFFVPHYLRQWHAGDPITIAFNERVRAHS